MSNQKWTAENIPGQDGRVAIVTGSSSGIGFETARVLADKGAEVIIAVRNLSKGNNAAAKINEQHPDAKLRVMQLDLANLESVRDFAEEFKSGFERLDLLINNAGVMVPPYSKTTDGFELQFGTNHLGHFALTGALIDLLKTTRGSRVVNVSSVAHRQGNIDFDDLNWEKRSYKPWKAYSDSKIANIYFTRELGRRLGNDTIVSMAHPGWTATELQRNSGMAGFFNTFFAQGIDMGALPTLYAAVAPEVETGDYYGPSGMMEMRGFPTKAKIVKRALDDQIAARLWDVSERLTATSY